MNSDLRTIETTVVGTQPATDVERMLRDLRDFDAKVTVSAYTRRQGLPEPARADLYRQLVDQLGLNGRPMRTSRHHKVNGKRAGEL